MSTKTKEIVKRLPDHKRRSEKIQTLITPGLKRQIDEYCEERDINPSELFRLSLETFFRSNFN